MTVLEKAVTREDGRRSDCPYEKLPAPWTPSTGGKGYRATRITAWSPPVDGLYASVSHEEDYAANGDYRRFKTRESCQKRCDQLNKLADSGEAPPKATKDTKATIQEAPTCRE